MKTKFVSLFVTFSGICLVLYFLVYRGGEISTKQFDRSVSDVRLRQENNFNSDLTSPPTNKIGFNDSKTKDMLLESETQPRRNQITSEALNSRRSRLTSFINEDFGFASKLEYYKGILSYLDIDDQLKDEIIAELAFNNQRFTTELRKIELRASSNNISKDEVENLASYTSLDVMEKYLDEKDFSAVVDFISSENLLQKTNPEIGNILDAQFENVVSRHSN